MTHRLPPLPWRAVLLASASWLILGACGPAASEDENTPPSEQQSTCEARGPCAEDLPEDRCEGNRVAVLWSRDPLGCTCEPVRQNIDCAIRGQICVDGACAEPSGMCQGVTCPRREDGCNDQTAVNFLGPGTCEPDTGECDYGEARTLTDCTSLGPGFACQGGRCVAPSDPCEQEGCRAPDDTCDDDIAVRYTGRGRCSVEDAEAVCDYARVTTREDCSERDFICRQGRCVDPDNPCLDVTCDTPPDPDCEGNTAISYDDGEGTCEPDTGECDYSMLEQRTDCPTDQICQMGTCGDAIDPCEQVTCEAPDPTCEDTDTVRSYMDAGTCDSMTGCVITRPWRCSPTARWARSAAAAHVRTRWPTCVWAWTARIRPTPAISTSWSPTRATGPATR